MKESEILQWMDELENDAFGAQTIRKPNKRITYKTEKTVREWFRVRETQYERMMEIVRHLNVPKTHLYSMIFALGLDRFEQIFVQNEEK